MNPESNNGEQPSHRAKQTIDVIQDTEQHQVVNVTEAGGQQCIYACSYQRVGEISAAKRTHDWLNLRLSIQNTRLPVASDCDPLKA